VALRPVLLGRIRSVVVVLRLCERGSPKSVSKSRRRLFTSSIVDSHRDCKQGRAVEDYRIHRKEASVVARFTAYPCRALNSRVVLLLLLFLRSEQHG
jgi:hypothetical protein